MYKIKNIKLVNTNNKKIPIGMKVPISVYPLDDCEFIYWGYAWINISKHPNWKKMERVYIPYIDAEDKYTLKADDGSSFTVPYYRLKLRKSRLEDAPYWAMKDTINKDFYNQVCTDCFYDD